MKKDTDYLVPDKWHSITIEGELIESNEDRNKVISEKAYYYVQQEYRNSLHNGMFPYYDYFVYDRYFRETEFKYKGLTCISIYDLYNGTTSTCFKIKDRLGAIASPSTFGQGIHTFSKAFIYLKELDKYSGWSEFSLKKENDKLNDKIRSLEEEIKSLSRENTQLHDDIEKYHKSKDMVRQLYKLLCNKEA